MGAGLDRRRCDAAASTGRVAHPDDLIEELLIQHKICTFHV